MILTVNHDGKVLGTEVVQGSGNPQLDRRAEAIARANHGWVQAHAMFGPCVQAFVARLRALQRA